MFGGHGLLEQGDRVHSLLLTHSSCDHLPLVRPDTKMGCPRPPPLLGLCQVCTGDSFLRGDHWGPLLFMKKTGTNKNSSTLYKKVKRLHPPGNVVT